MIFINNVEYPAYAEVFINCSAQSFPERQARRRGWDWTVAVDDARVADGWVGELYGLIHGGFAECRVRPFLSSEWYVIG